MNTHPTTHFFTTQHTGSENGTNQLNNGFSVSSADNSKEVSSQKLHPSSGGIPSHCWQLKGHSKQSLVCQWARVRQAFTPLVPNLDAEPLHCPRHYNNPPGPGLEPWDMSPFERNLAWLLVGGGLDYLLDNENLEVADLVAQITHKTRESVAWYVGRRINRTFSPWVDNPRSFRGVLESTRSIVSGSLALQAALAKSFSCNNMDIYVPAGKSKARIIKYLEDEESYVVVQSDDLMTQRHEPIYRFVTSVTRLQRTIRTLQGDVTRSIDIMQSTRGATKPVASFSATWSMNWIGADEIMVLYRDMTFAYGGVLNSPCGLNSTENAIWLSKYIDRGFTLLNGTDIMGAAPWPCTAICAQRQATETGEDSFRVSTSTYDPEKSPENAWIINSYRCLSNFEYMCERHEQWGSVGQRAPLYVMMYNDFRRWKHHVEPPQENLAAQPPYINF